MYAQLVTMQGPRGPELVAAADRAGRERIMPMLAADPEVSSAHRGTYVLRRPDGEQVILILSDTAEALERSGKLINESELLPGEDPVLLREPDSVDLYEVAHAFDRNYQEIR